MFFNSIRARNNNNKEGFIQDNKFLYKQDKIYMMNFILKFMIIWFLVM